MKDKWYKYRVMNIKIFNDEIPYIIIDNYYDEQELRLIWEELHFLGYPHKLKRATLESGGATGDAGELLKHNFHRYIDRIYSERELSNILTVNRKLFDDDCKILRQHPHWFFQNVEFNKDYTQIGYYEDNDGYGEHHDNSLVTALTWLYKEPKKFTGGDLFLSSDKIKIDCVNNRTLIFPSMIPHSVNEIHMNKENPSRGYGRYDITQFGAIDTRKS